MVNSVSFNKVEEFLVLLCKLFGILFVVFVFVNYDLDVFLIDWLINFSIFEGFFIGNDVEFEEVDDSGV